MTIQLIQASAHHLPMIPDASVHCLVCSPPYYSLRRYEGSQDICWETVEYAPMPGMPPIRVQGCEAGCVHEWVNGSIATDGRNDAGRNNVDGFRGHNAYSDAGGRQATQGAYCRHCAGWRGPLGLEPDISMYIGHLVLCLREWKRILRDDGTCWVNLGDSYAGGGNRSGEGEARNLKTERFHGGTAHLQQRRVTGITGLRPKNLMLVPARFALAAQAEGWIVRNDCIWNKPNPMPESVRDRFTRSHEYIFLLAKQERYYFDAEAIKEKAEYGENRATFRGGGIYTNNNSFLNSTPVNGDGEIRERPETAGRNARSVWNIATQPTPMAHFATYPERIPEIAILAGTSAYGCCSQCGAGWVRCVERVGDRATHGINNVADDAQGRHGSNSVFKTGLVPVTETTGWQPGCTCGCPDVVPAVCCDPFHGSGTTARVALRLGRSYIGVDLSQTYLSDITAQRLGDGVQMEMSL